MKFTLLIFILLMAGLMSNTLLASPYLPAQYPVEKISISVTNRSAKNNSENYKISIHGNGSSFFSKNGKAKQPLKITNDTLIELLNDFYTVHFFEIDDNFGVKKQVILKKNKIVTTVLKKEPPLNKKRVCVHLRSYKKCVTVVDNQPLAVAQIVNKIETLLPPKP